MEASWSLVGDTYFQAWLDSHRIKVFTSAFIFGSNASGKTNVLKVLQFIDRKIELSHSEEKKDTLVPSSFLLNQDQAKKPSFFEVIFQSNNNIYRYNFSLLSWDVQVENLYQVMTKTEKVIFERKLNIFEWWESFKDNTNIQDVAEKKTKSYTLFVSAVKEWIEDETINEVSLFFRQNLNSICLLQDNYGWYTMQRIKEDLNFKEKVIGYLKQADFLINDIDIEMNIDDSEKETKWKVVRKFKVDFQHPVFNGDKVVDSVSLRLDSQESLGTQSFFKMLWPIIDTLEKGNILLLDELNASLHPYLCKFIIDLFNNLETNPNRAQLIATLHDTTLLNYSDELNKWQIWFTERNKYGATDLFSLIDFDIIRNWDKNYQSKYLNGRFGAVPFIRK